MIPAIDREAFLAKRLRDHGRHIEDGLTTTDIRRERMRKAIQDAGVAEAIIGRGKDGEPLRYRDYFELTYGTCL